MPHMSPMTRWWKSTPKTVSHAPTMSKIEEVEETGIKILISKKLLTRLPVWLALMKALNNSYKLKNEITKILHFLYYHKKILEIVYNNLIKSL